MDAHPPIAAISINAETKAIFHVSKGASSLGFFCSVGTSILLSIKSHNIFILIVKTNKLTGRSHHLDVPITFTHNCYMLCFFIIAYISTKLNTADPTTKACTGPTCQRQWGFLRGYRLHFPPTTPTLNIFTHHPTN